MLQSDPEQHELCADYEQAQQTQRQARQQADANAEARSRVPGSAAYGSKSEL
ncbi:MAG: hypothetical protein GPOALKHO_000756 [Sodalis sp.]|nr:MAG: hypothetical protein GPOALKHO_000756 [Sodalis sp.]